MTITTRKNILLVFIATLFLASFAIGHAQFDDNGANGGFDDNGANSGGGTFGNGETLVNPLKADSLEELLLIVVQAAVRIGAIILVLAIVWVGFLFVKARGNAEELKKARAAFMWTLIGGLILLGAEGIMRAVEATANAL